jgi:glutamate-1-semialdehyde 2,1-aminomutase
MSTPENRFGKNSINRAHLAALMAHEEQKFITDHPKSAALYERAQRSLLGGVPMNWMKKWAGKFPVFVAEAHGAHFTDVDGRDYVDLCLGDTGAMTGHSPAPAVEAIARQSKQGITLMLPTEDAVWVGEELAHRFGLPYWQFTLTATDANRFSIRIAREITSRPKILVYNYCYHGSVDESFISIINGKPAPRRGNIGPPVNPAETTRVIEFNDLAALEAALAPRDVACILAEPVMTNVGIVHPDPGYWQSATEIARGYGTLLIMDETHTICAGPGGYTREHAIRPDIFVIGKPIASGLPAGTYGCSAEVAEKITHRIHLEDCDTGGIGGTLAGNALSLAAIRATLEHVLTPQAFAHHMIPLAQRFAKGVADAIEAVNRPWHVTRLGCRAEYLFRPNPARNGGEAAAAADFDLERYMHLYALNRGVLLTPFPNMALMSLATTDADVDLHTRIFESAVRELTAA